jgi:hypothetical protein
MKYLEELSSGETFQFDSENWIVTSDFKSNGKRLCYNLKNGFPSWMDANYAVEISPIYTLDKNNNILPIKEYKNETHNIL